MNDAIQQERLKHIRHVALDMDGTLYNGATLFPYTRRALEQLEECNISYTYLTNNSSRSVQAYLEKLRNLGLPADRSRIYTSSLATLDYLQEAYPDVKKIFVFGTESLRDEFARSGYEIIRENDNGEPEIVVVGFDTTMTYERLCKTAYWLQQGKPFIATHPDKICPTDEPTVLVDCGSVCACLAAATGRRPHAILGKPSPRMLQNIIKKHHLQPHELAMVGDRLYTDMAMADQSGALGVLVLSGETRPQDITPDIAEKNLVVESILTFTQMLSCTCQIG